MSSVVIIDDDIGLGAILEASYQQEGYTTRLCGLDDYFDEITLRQPDLIVLDSLEIASILVQTFRLIRSQLPARRPAVLVLGDEDRSRTSLDAGFDDYLPRPFSVQELLARSRALLTQRVPTDPSEILRHRDISLNLETHRVTRRGRNVHLGPTEFRLLKLFLQAPKHLFTRREILTHVWNDATRDERMVDVSIKKLRSRLNIGATDDAIRTVRGAGYGLH